MNNYNKPIKLCGPDKMYLWICFFSWSSCVRTLDCSNRLIHTLHSIYLESSYSSCGHQLKSYFGVTFLSCHLPLNYVQFLSQVCV